jgi:hypothetical protein
VGHATEILLPADQDDVYPIDGQPIGLPSLRLIRITIN